jgi:predicted transglutaminase-like cysteine proteinase
MVILSFSLIQLIGIGMAQGRADPILLPAVDQSLEDGGAAQPTPAWTRFCERLPAECMIDPAQPAVITLDARSWSLIVSVNGTVNAAIKPATDQEHWGVVDRWDYPADGFGDCEDYQLLKRRLLEKAGLPRRAMRMVVVLDEQGAGHAVLMVRTDRGDFVLDNKRDAVLSWNKTGYVYLKREGEVGRAWVSLGGPRALVTTANP